MVCGIGPSGNYPDGCQGPPEYDAPDRCERCSFRDGDQWCAECIEFLCDQCFGSGAGTAAAYCDRCREVKQLLGE